MVPRLIALDGPLEGEIFSREGRIKELHAALAEPETLRDGGRVRRLKAEIVGYTLEELHPVSIETWRRFSHPDDLKDSDEQLQSHFPHNHNDDNELPDEISKG